MGNDKISVRGMLGIVEVDKAECSNDRAMVSVSSETWRGKLGTLEEVTIGATSQKSDEID